MSLTFLLALLTVCVRRYKFTREMDAGGAPLTLVSEVFEQLKPGLSSYASNPSGGAKSLLPLLQIGADVIPDHLEPQTVCPAAPALSICLPFGLNG